MKLVPTDLVTFLNSKIDAEIVPLIDALRASGFETLGSCSGHAKKSAYVDLAVQGMKGLRAFVLATNRVQGAVEKQALVDVALNFSESVATACDFERCPDWIMLSLSIESFGDAGPSARLLAKIARLYRPETKRLPAKPKAKPAPKAKR